MKYFLIPSAAFLAAVAVASLSQGASAQSDAGFVAALGKPVTGLATMAQLKTQPQIPAGTKVPPLAASEESFANMVWMAMIEGKHTAPTPASKYDNYAYSAAANTKKISVFTAPLPGGGFRVERMLVSAATVSFDGDTMHIKNWTFLLDGKGRVQLARRGEGTERRGGELIMQPVADLDLADPAVKARFDEILKFWDDRFD